MGKPIMVAQVVGSILNHFKKAWLFPLFSFYMVSLLFKIGLLALLPEFYVQNFYLPKLYGILEVGAMVNFRFLESKLLLEF